MGAPSPAWVIGVPLPAVVPVCVETSLLSHNPTGINVYQQYLSNGCKSPSKIVTRKCLNI